MCPAEVGGASQDPTAQLLITGHPAATAALAPLPAAARLASLQAHVSLLDLSSDT